MTFRDFDLRVADNLKTGTVLFSVVNGQGDEYAFIFRQAYDKGGEELQVELLDFYVTTNNNYTFCQHVTGHDVFSISGAYVVHRELGIPLLVKDGCLIAGEGVIVEKLDDGTINYYIDFHNGHLKVTSTHGKMPTITFIGHGAVLQNGIVEPTLVEVKPIS